MQRGRSRRLRCCRRARRVWWFPQGFPSVWVVKQVASRESGGS
ncbi:hypothetical protein ACFPRL_31115 [Pseudoclavibacter helvolus]